MGNGARRPHRLLPGLGGGDAGGGGSARLRAPNPSALPALPPAEDRKQVLTSSLDKTLALWGSEVRRPPAAANYHFEPPTPPLDASGSTQILRAAFLRTPDSCLLLPPPLRRARMGSGWSRRA